MRIVNLFCNNKKFQYDGFSLKKGKELFEKQGEGLESKVFKINDDTVLKVYKDCNDKAKLDKEMIEELSQINTNRIVLPNEIITLEDGTLKGYSMDYIEETEDNIIDFSKEQLIEELELLKEDLIELGENKVEIGDLREENTISNDKSFYLIDCGDYLKRKEKTIITNIQFFNEYIIDDILTDIVFTEAIDLSYGLEMLKELRKYLHNGNYIGDYLKDEMHYDENINEFIKRRVN